MTSIEWLIEELEGSFSIIARAVGVKKYNEIVRNAIEMHKQEIIDAYASAVMKENNGDYIGMHEQSSGEIYYAETFVSKGSDDTLKDYHIVDTNEMVQLPQQEISDDQTIKMLKDMNKQPMRFHCVPKEISDEEIEKAARDYDNGDIYGPPLVNFEQGAFWYREQLKQRQ
jgi:hypothetical protein